MDNFDPSKYPTLKEPIKSNTLCIGLFASDKNYYRSSIIKKVKSGKY